MVTDRMQTKLNRLRTAKKIGYVPGLGVREDRNALALHYIESGAIRRFSARHKIMSKQELIEGQQNARCGRADSCKWMTMSY